MKFTIINSKYQAATGPNGSIHIAEKGKPHLCYSIEAAVMLGLAATA